MINSKLAKDLQGKDTILIGENHGVLENTTFVKNFVQELRQLHSIKFVGFEYPIFIRDKFNHAVKKEDFEHIKTNEFSQMHMKDGRFSKYHFELLVYLNKSNIPFIFFDSGRGTWDDRDSLMYEIIKMQRNTYKEGIEIIVAGNIHTELDLLKIGNAQNKIYKPLGSYFDKHKTLHIKLIYHQGEYFNFSRKAFTKVENNKQGFEKISNSEYLYHIPLATSLGPIA